MIWKWLIGNLDSHFKVSWFMSPIYLFLFGQTTSRTRYSRVKKMTTKLSMRSMTRTMRGKSTRPFSSFWSSSAVEMMKVTVEITTSREVRIGFGLFHLMLLLKQGNTMKREKRARTWASLLVQGYSIVLHSQDRHWNKKMWYRKHLKRTTYIAFLNRTFKITYISFFYSNIMSVSLCVCLFPNSSETANPNELKFWVMILLRVQMVLG